jgi:hypothetical protein
MKLKDSISEKNKEILLKGFGSDAEFVDEDQIERLASQLFTGRIKAKEYNEAKEKEFNESIDL